MRSTRLQSPHEQDVLEKICVKSIRRATTQVADFDRESGTLSNRDRHHGDQPRALTAPLTSSCCPLDQCDPAASSLGPGWHQRRIKLRSGLAFRAASALPDPQAPTLVRVPAAVADEVLALAGNVLGEFREEDLSGPYRSSRPH